MLNILIFKFPLVSSIFCAFQTRSLANATQENPLAGNISFQVGDDPKAVLAARLDLFDKLRAFGMDEWSECRQVHGDEIIINPEATPLQAKPDELPAADGMMTNRRGLGLMIKTADCQPVFIIDQKGRHLMALHVGWRGNRISFPQKAIIKFCQAYQLEPGDLLAVRGPSLGPNAAQFINFDREWGKEWERWFNQKSKCMNLWSLTRWQLQNLTGESGLKDENIYEIDLCTLLNENLFFSYRRNKRTGRQANFIWISS